MDRLMKRWRHRSLAVAARMMVAALMLICALAQNLAAQTRLYLPNTGAADVSPVFTFESTWNETTGADRIETATTKINSALTNKASAKAVTANTDILSRQFVSNPIVAQTIAAGTVKGTIRVLESAGNDNIDKVRIKIIVVNGAGTTLTGTILARGSYGPTNEWATSLTNRRIADGDTTSAVTANEGDRIVIEIGFLNTTTGTSITGTMNFGDDNASDCADDETGTAACNPFVELSQTITFQGPAGRPPRRAVVIE